MVSNEKDSADINKDELNRMKLELKRDLLNEIGRNPISDYPTKPQPVIEAAKTNGPTHADLAAIQGNIKGLQDELATVYASVS